MTAITPTTGLEIQKPDESPAKPPATDIFNLLLGSVAAVPSADRSVGIGRKGAPAAQQRRSPSDPLAGINPTDAAVAQMASQGPAKATLAAAEHEARSSSEATPARAGRKAVAPQGPAAEASRSTIDQSPVAKPMQNAAARPPSERHAEAQSATAPAGHQAALHPTTQRHAPGAQTGATSALNRLIHPAAIRGADRAQAAPRAILRPIVAPAAQGRSTIKPAPQAPSPQRPDDPDADFSSQLSRGFAAILRQNGGSLTLHLQPQDLGEMTIRMDLTPGNVAAAFEVGSTQARDLLNDNLITLRSALEARGINVETLTVSVSERAAQDALPTRAEAQLGGADPDGGAAGHKRDPGTARQAAQAEPSGEGPRPDARSAQTLPDDGISGVDIGGAMMIRLALDAVA